MGQINIGGTKAVQLKGYTDSSITSDQTFTFPDTGGELVVTPGTADIETTGAITAAGGNITLTADGEIIGGVVEAQSSKAATSSLFSGRNDSNDIVFQVNKAGSLLLDYSTSDLNSSITRWKVGGNDVYYFRADGSAQKPGGGSWDSISDSRSKNSVIPYETGLAQLKQIETVKYKYNGSDIEYVGVVAQQVESIMPELVSISTGTMSDGEEVQDLRTVNQTPLTFALINAVKEMSTRIEALEAKLTALQEAQS